MSASRHDIPRKLNVPFDELTAERKAELFDALFGCERIRVLGYSRGGETGHSGQIEHIGIEFWTTHPEKSSDVSIKALYDFLDGMVPIKEEV